MLDPTLHLLHLTDTHIYADAELRFGAMDTRPSFLDCLQRASASGPYDAVLLTGDLAAEAETGAYRWLIDAMRNVAVPVLCLPGNHDHERTMVATLAAAAWQVCEHTVFGRWLIVMLNSRVDDAPHGMLAAAELERLATLLADHREHHTLVCLHHHPIAINSAWMDTMGLRNAAAFWSIVDRHPQVKAVLWGHIHQNYDRFRGHVRLLATPSTCVQFAPRSKGFAIDRRAPGYRRLQLDPAGGMATVIERTAL